MAHERICVVCGKQYQYCKRCKQFEHLPTWMFAYCSEPCKETYMTLNKFDFGHISAKEAMDELETYKVKIVNKEMLKSVKQIKKELSDSKKKSEPKTASESDAKTDDLL